MHFWIIKDGEPLPLPGRSVRRLRSGQICEDLRARGHSVEWWTSNFDHFRKVNLCDEYQRVEVASDFAIHLLPGQPYRKNVSVARFRHHRLVARELYRRGMGCEKKPDLILCSMPTIELSTAAILIGKNLGVPVVVDLRDLWPDIFAEILPGPVGLLATPAIHYLKRKLSWVCRRAHGVTAITPEFLQWGLRSAGRAANDNDGSFWLAHPSLGETSLDDEATNAFWFRHGVDFQNDFVVAYLGAISEKMKLAPIIDAARKLEGLPVKFVLAGSGDLLPDLKTRAAGLKNVVLPGWVDGPCSAALLAKAKAGVMPISGRIDYEMSVPNKAIEYFSAKLPILSSLGGRLEKMIREHAVGYQYDGAERFIEGVRLLYENPSRREAMAKNAFALYTDQFRADKVYGAMAEHLEGCVLRFGDRGHVLGKGNLDVRNSRRSL